MASLKTYDRRTESLVMELRTRFDAECAELPEEDRTWLAGRLHRRPGGRGELGITSARRPGSPGP